MRSNKLAKIRQRNKTTAAPDRSNDKPGTLLATMQAKMVLDVAALKNIPDVVEKAKAKLAMLPDYLPFSNTYFEKEHNYPNDVLVRVMIWLFDVLSIEKALGLALLLIKQGVHVMPENFGRTMEAFVVDAMYDWANMQLKNEQTASPYLDMLIETMERDKWDLHDLMYSKIYAMQAKHCMLRGDYQGVIDMSVKAEEKNPKKHGTKKLRQDAEKKLKAEKDAALDADAKAVADELDATDNTQTESDDKAEPKPDDKSEPKAEPESDDEPGSDTTE